MIQIQFLVAHISAHRSIWMCFSVINNCCRLSLSNLVPSGLITTQYDGYSNTRLTFNFSGIIHCELIQSASYRMKSDELHSSSASVHWRVVGSHYRNKCWGHVDRLQPVRRLTRSHWNSENHGILWKHPQTQTECDPHFFFFFFSCTGATQRTWFVFCWTPKHLHKS